MTLEQAIAFAAQVHEGQLDRAGAPYILHPLRVMLRMRTPAERRVAVLHDVIEDGGVLPEVLRRKGLPLREVRAVVALSTDKAKEAYDAFIGRIARNGLATRVKLADLADNLDRTRFRSVGPDDEARFARYRKARRRLRVRSR
jgi:(p)ppGpp synthase/HD superfamily hydrolase